MSEQLLSHRPLYAPAPETYQTPEFAVTTLAPEGLGFGEGSISANIAKEPTVNATVAHVVYGSVNILTPVPTESTDDGCSDGRGIEEVYDIRGVQPETINLNRPRVFGGAAAMTSASAIGLGRAKGMSLQNVFNKSVQVLKKHRFDFGAHTAGHAHEPNCGCGAIDEAPEALKAAIRYESEIKQTIAAMGYDTQGLDEVYDNFRDYVGDEASKLNNYTGQGVMASILSAGKLIKRLRNGHKERRIAWNKVRGFTINQELIRTVTDGEGQVFGVDAWRLEDIADFNAQTPDAWHEGTANDIAQVPGEKHRALLSELVYTLGTAVVLTKGDLPVDLIEAV